MDERVHLYTTGAPIPEWDLLHSLPLNRPAGPVCQDTATIFRINSTFMDVTDQPYMGRQVTAIGVLILALFGLVPVGLFFFLSWESKLGSTYDAIFFIGMLFPFTCGFWYFAWRLGRDEFFSLTRRPIRFNRQQQKIYTIRRRRFFAKPGEGDVTWEAPWNAQSIFCIHRHRIDGLWSYHIRHYTVDDHGNVLRAFSIGRVWHCESALPGLLSQWNYWREYMNHGPERLPKPALFMSEKETVGESFMFCMLAMGIDGLAGRIVLMPLTLILTAARALSMWTCREPVWPKEVTAVSAIAPDDAFDQPRGDTPVGWGPTSVARQGGAWPREEIRNEDQWRGETDVMQNALLWAEASAPTA